MNVRVVDVEEAKRDGYTRVESVMIRTPEDTVREVDADQVPGFVQQGFRLMTPDEVRWYRKSEAAELGVEYERQVRSESDARDSRERWEVIKVVGVALGAAVGVSLLYLLLRRRIVRHIIGGD